MLQLVTYLVYLILISKGPASYYSLFVRSVYIYMDEICIFFLPTNIYTISSYELFNLRIVCRSTMFIQSTSIFVTTQHEHAYKHWEDGKITPGTYTYMSCAVRLVHRFFFCISFRSFLPNDHQYKRNVWRKKNYMRCVCVEHYIQYMILLVSQCL